VGPLATCALLAHLPAWPRWCPSRFDVLAQFLIAGATVLATQRLRSPRSGGLHCPPLPDFMDADGTPRKLRVRVSRGRLAGPCPAHPRRRRDDGDADEAQFLARQFRSLRRAPQGTSARGLICGTTIGLPLSTTRPVMPSPIW